MDIGKLHNNYINMKVLDSNFKFKSKNVVYKNSDVESTLNELKQKTEEGLIFSTTETRIGTWIDNKPLYMRVYNAYNTNSINLSSIHPDYIEILSTNLRLSGYKRNPYYTSPTDYFRTLIDGNNILLCETSASSIQSWTTTILYTKTTD